MQKKLFKNIISHFIKPEYINDLKINCKNSRNFVELKYIDLGAECNLFINNLPDDIQMSIRKSCLEFLICTATDLQSRFLLTDPFFENLKFLKLDHALNLKKDQELCTLQEVWTKYNVLEDVDGPSIDAEWKKIAICLSEHNEEKQKLLEGSIEEFWHYLSTYKNFQDEFEFANIAKLAHLCMCLPHST